MAITDGEILGGKLKGLFRLQTYVFILPLDKLKPFVSFKQNWLLKFAVLLQIKN